MKKMLSALVCVALVLAIGAVLMADPGNYGAMPSFSAKDARGATINSANYKGKVIIIDFWATWCPPCRAEIPDFIRLQKAYGPRGLQIIGFSCDRDASDHSSFVVKQGFNYPSIYLDTQPNSIFREKFENQIGQVSGIPTTIIIDRKGMIVDKVVGGHPYSYFEEQVRKYL